MIDQVRAIFTAILSPQCALFRRLAFQPYFAVFILALVLPLAEVNGSSSTAGAFARISDIRAMPREQAALAIPVRVRGVVTWQNGIQNLTIQDDSAGIWIDMVEARKRGIWQGDDTVFLKGVTGMEVEIEGHCDPGGYAPLILPATLRVLGPKPLPKPMAMDPARFFSGADDCQRIKVRGVVQGSYPLDPWVVLVMDANPGRFTALVSRNVVSDPGSLVDADVSLTGVGAVRFNLRGEATGSRIRVGSPGDLKIERPPPPPDEVPRVTLDQLVTFRPVPKGPHRVRAEGTVTFSIPGRFFYLQDGTSAVRVQTDSKISLNSGDRVEAAGFVEISGLIGTLSYATVRKIGVGGLPKPLAISPVEILAIYNATSAARRMERDYDGQLIRCRARLLAVETETATKEVKTLILEQPAATDRRGSFVFEAQLYEDKSKPLLLPPIGSELELTGLVQLDLGPIDGRGQGAQSIPVSLGLILRTAQDVVVLTEPSQWTARRFAVLLAVVLTALGAALVWNLMLNSQVRKKSRLLAREISARRDAALDFRTTLRERNRLAANLHDTLPQTMSAIGLQLDACEFSLRRQGIESLPPLDLIRTMVGYAVKELRGAVWEMRSLSLRGRSFTAALQAVVDRSGEGHAAKISVSTEGPFDTIPEFVSGNLLLLVQEALHNALHHGHAENITVRFRTDEPGAPVRLEVADDGRGFTPDTGRGPEQGHFGIMGMTERAQRLGGSLRIESLPGRGTCIVVEVRQDLDDDSADEESMKIPGPNS